VSIGSGPATVVNFFDPCNSNNTDD